MSTESNGLAARLWDLGMKLLTIVVIPWLGIVTWGVMKLRDMPSAVQIEQAHGELWRAIDRKAESNRCESLMNEHIRLDHRDD